jgi:RimJ/RimL family protein N-acetyltransferase
MTATRPEATDVSGRFVRLERLRREHLPALGAAIGHPVVFAGGFGGGPAAYRDSPAGFIEWAESFFRWDDCNPYAIFLVGGPHDRELVGTTTLADFDLAREAAHLGWTAYDPRVWGTAVNAEVKLLLLGIAFDCGFGRVKIQADALNERSCAAIAGLGATFEGIVRRDLLRADGSWRNSAVYSIIRDDWPRVRTGLEQRLERHGDRPVLFRTRSMT